MNSQLQLLVRYRLAEAKETIEEAKLLLEYIAFRGSINRSYYAMLYALLGLLATRGLGTSKHSGVISLFDREFVKTGLLQRTSLAACIVLSMNGRLMTTAKCYSQIRV
ncbi:HEPN domain-containing protein [cf. Phormidesmis sp. LEGE 11477]|uniref:HEPN domain-containing protein n=1 Tax=cf. Phormidesmis sp. LEGE 11477 TaxID=1828680 RepID=UPI00187F0D09|nr:HEPN domain-containing protein [cf. Phormidesmis sp. LEGE 11477]MBE9063552.1 HEPN domain-containing protein [cf. Phormidesmis sp. LEGE 11477]